MFLRSSVMRRSLLVALLIAILVVPPISGAQQPAGETVRISTKSELVMVPVLVTEKDGSHVAGLKKEDFTVSENGKPQKVAVFEEVKTTSSGFARVPQAPGEFSNRYTGESNNRITVLMVDMLNTPFMDQGFAREQLVQYLASQVNESEPTALMALTSKGVITLHPFTSRPAQLVAALKRTGSAIGSAELTSAEQVATQDAGFGNVFERLAVFARSGDWVLDEARRREALVTTLHSFQQISNAVAGLPGRKSLVWITGGFPFEMEGNGNVSGIKRYQLGQGLNDSVMPTQTAGRDQAAINMGARVGVPTDLAKSLRPIYERTLQVLANANVAVYPVDARGLMAYFGITAVRQNLPNEVVEDLHQSSITTMINFASVTGGRAFYNRNDLTNAFREATQDSQTYYHVGYYRDLKDSKPGWRKLEVKVARPGAQVRARKGFLLTETTMAASNSRQLDLTSAVQSPLDYTGIPLLVRWLGTAPGEGKTKVGFAVVTGGGSVMVDADNHNKLDLDVIAVAMKPSGESVDQVGQTIGGNVDQAAITDLQTNGLTYENMFELPAGTYTVRFVVRDNVTGRMGSVQAPLKVD
jgi:VWFA-related protein